MRAPGVKTYGLAWFMRIVLILMFVFLVSGIRSSAESISGFYKRSLGFMPYQSPVYTYTNDNDVSERVKDTFGRMDETVASAKQMFASDNQRFVYMDTAVEIVFALLSIGLLNIFFFARVELDDKSIRVYTPPAALLGPLAKPAVFEPDGIRSMIITRTTPLGPDLDNPSKINWRDRLDFEQFSLPGYVFAPLSKFYEDLTALKPGITTNFYKNTLAENAREYGSQ